MVSLQIELPTYQKLIKLKQKYQNKSKEPKNITNDTIIFLSLIKLEKEA